MKVKIVGVQAQDCTLDNGYAYKGDTLHAIHLKTLAVDSPKIHFRVLAVWVG